MKNGKWIFMRFIAATLSFLLGTACAYAETPEAAKADSAINPYRGTLTLIDYAESDTKNSDLENAPVYCFDQLIEQWQEAHPDIHVVEKKRSTVELASLACMDHLPDVFMLPASTGRTYAKYGKIHKLTEGIMASEYADQYDYLMIAPYLYYGHFAAFPALTESFSVVIYDAQAWKAAGFESFPTTWEALRAGMETFSNMGYEALLAFGDKDNYAAIIDIISPLIAYTDSLDWFQQLIDGDQNAMLTDNTFSRILNTACDMLSDGVIHKRHTSMVTGDSIQCFVAQKCAAILIEGSNVYKLLEECREKAPGLYGNLAFAALPCPPGLSDENRYMPLWIDSGLYVNAKAAENPEKLAACVELCKFLTGPDYADAVARKWGMKSLTGVTESTLDAYRSSCDDEVLQRLSEYTSSGFSYCPNVTIYLHSTVWSSCAEALHDMVDEALNSRQNKNAPTAEIVANDMQNIYEKYYLGMEDFSKAVDM